MFWDKKKDDSQVTQLMEAVTTFRVSNGIPLTVIILAVVLIVFYETMSALKEIVPVVFIVLGTGCLLLITNYFFKLKALAEKHKRDSELLLTMKKAYVQKKLVGIEKTDETNDYFKKSMKILVQANKAEADALQELIKTAEDKE